MRQKTLDGFDFEVISTLKHIESKKQGDRYNWKDFCIHPRTKLPITLSSYFSHYLTNGFTPEEVKDNLMWGLQQKGLKLPYEMERRLDIALSARPGERKTYINPFKKHLMQNIRSAV